MTSLALQQFVAHWADTQLKESATTAHDRQIDTTDRQIDALVYLLYGLTTDEIKIVEGR